MAAAATAAPATTTILITGANRGIGLGLVQHYAKVPGVRVIGTTRDVKNAAELQGLAKANKSVSLVTVDVSDSKSVATLPAQLAALQPPVTALDVLIHNAGIASGVKGHNGVGPLELERVESWMAVYRTNVVGAWDVTNQVLPLLRASKAPKIVHISSLAGQFAYTLDGPLPGLAIAYRASKSAMNQLAAVQSREYNLAHVTAHAAAAAAPGDAKLQAAAAAAPPIVTVLAVHPGGVDTDIHTEQAGGFKPPNMLTVEQSAAGIVKALAAAKVDPKARFLDAVEQKELSW